MPQTRTTRKVTNHKTRVKATSRRRAHPVASRAKTRRHAPVPIIKHHAKHLWHATPMFVHGMVTGAFVGLVIVFSLGKPSDAGALTVSAARDCDSYAIIHCGALSTAELKKDYAASAYVRPIYKHFGITAADMSNIGSQAVAGRVYDNGVIKVGGKIVATKAITAARKYVKGSHTVRINGYTYYVRYVSAALSRSSEAAFVVMKNGVFDYAVMAPCGNPVMATAKAVTTAIAQTTPATPSSTPTPTPTVTTNTPPPSNQPAITQASAITTLPNTGPGAVLIVLTLSAIGGYVFHRTHHHIRRRRAQLR